MRWIGAVALFGMVAYLFTPLSAAGAEGEPTGFAINIRYVVPAMLAALALLPLPRLSTTAAGSGRCSACCSSSSSSPTAPTPSCATPRASSPWRSPSSSSLVPAGCWRCARGAPRRRRSPPASPRWRSSCLAIGYPVQRHYLSDRFLNDGPAEERIPGMGLDSAYRWARGIEDARIGLAGTTAGFLQYGFYGTDLSNRVLYLGEKGPHGAFNAIPTCRAFRAAVNAADLDYLVTSPFLDFIDTEKPIASPEAGWLRGEPAVRPIDRSGPVTVWRVGGELDPAACRPR